MDQHPSGPGKTNTGGPGGNATRPAVMENLSTTQLDELERQYNEQDRKDWNMTAESYGWTHEQADEVWNWFNQRPVAGPPGTPGEVH